MCGMHRNAPHLTAPRVRARAQWLSVARGPFIAAFVALAATEGASDALAPLLTLAMAASSGYVASLGMMLPHAVVPARDRQKAGFVMSMSPQVGIFVGALVASLVLKQDSS